MPSPRAYCPKVREEIPDRDPLSVENEILDSNIWLLEFDGATH
jgi:hypothetical protein